MELLDGLVVGNVSDAVDGMVLPRAVSTLVACVIVLSS